ADLQEFRDKTQKTQIHLSEYRKFHAETVRQGLDPDDGETEIALLNKLEAELKRLDAALDTFAHSPREGPDATSNLRNDPVVKKHYDDSRLVAEHLRMALIDDVRVGIERSNQSIRQSLWIVGGATVWTGLILLTLLYYFREWMFTPIRVLQAGVQRVHSGDFDQPILLTSGDELQELANEFNATTAP